MKPASRELSGGEIRTASTQATLRWSEIEAAVEAETGERLDQVLDKLAAKAQPDFPISVRLHAYGCEADILLGLPESFVYITDAASWRYYITVGGLNIEGVVSFYLLGQHHTEFERRHLISADTARRVFREFFETGLRSAAVAWEEGCY
jgi:hypothetical protein